MHLAQIEQVHQGSQMSKAKSRMQHNLVNTYSHKTHESYLPADYKSINSTVCSAYIHYTFTDSLNSSVFHAPAYFSRSERISLSAEYYT